MNSVENKEKQKVLKRLEESETRVQQFLRQKNK